MRQLLPHPDDAPDLWSVYAYPTDGRWLRANMVASADGAAAHDGRARGLSSDTDRHLFRILRALADVVVVAAGTVRDEQYGPARLPAEMTERRTAAGLPAQPVLAIVSGSLQLDWQSRLFTESTTRPVVVTSGAADATRRAHAAEVADVVVAGEDRVDVTAMLAALEARGHRRMLTEGGPSLLGQLVAADVLDELCLAVAPRLAGAGAPRIVTGQPAELAEARLAALLEEDGFLFARYVRAAS
ncbi:MAG TPA: pyrimidine reductase family protein [Mycobacteriales bacterium]|nr:pyrimidine reductase family protein [Mycobacteriales bacterium]